MPLRGEDGEVEGIVGIREDITKRKQAEQKFQASRRLLRMMIDTIPHAIYVKDSESRFSLVNRSFAELHNLTPQSMVGKHTTDLVLLPSYEMETLQDMDQRVLETGEPVIDPKLRVTGKEARC